MEEHGDALMVQAYCKQVRQHVVRSRVHSIPRPPDQPLREPLDDGDLLVGFFNLALR